jgi:5-methylcytosine-specific restriction protein B
LSSAKPFAFFIDEINRANVSSVFGELITLLEDDKRLGSENEITDIKLPYSKSGFGVPMNLHVFGTMNTADRSVEALDTALRRRFSFIEMAPQYDLPELQSEVAGTKLGDMLYTINKRIEKLLDKDHLIGHSYFIGAGSNIENLKVVFGNKILPLLQEYFFGDYSKIGLVLGEGFFEDQDDENDNVFARFRDTDISELAGRLIYRLKDPLNMEDEEFMDALNQMMGKG